MKRNLYFCERWRVEVGCVDGGSREWIYLHLSKLVSGLRLFSFLEMFFAKNDYVIFFFVSANKVILELVYLKWTKNLNILKKLILGFGQFCGLTVVFQIFKLVCPCFGRVWTLFSALKNLLLQVFLAPKLLKDPQIWDTPLTFNPLLIFERAIFEHFVCQKNLFRDFF